MTRLTLALTALLLLLIVGLAVAGPYPAPPPGYRIGQGFQVVALDTLWFTDTDPVGGYGGAATYFGPQVVKRSSLGARTVETFPACRADGVVLGAKKPFRFRLFAAGKNLGTTQVPVDTTMAVERPAAVGFDKYPCRQVIIATLDTLRLTPATSDTIWGATIIRDK